MSYDQDALDAASREVHMMLLREGSNWGTKACEEMGRVFMTAYLKAAPAEQGTLLEARQIISDLLPMVENLDDCGPRDEGWQSEKLMALIARARKVAA